MRVESPFSEKSSACFILERARGLRILTFGKIKKKVQRRKINKMKIKSNSMAVILSKLNTPPKSDVKKFFMEALDVGCGQSVN
ncbi:MAG: hypothetical protein J6C86_02075 [Bacteroidaceae bacterium]|nr:hypothetical protein [Bacteroidaceae bacterium]